MPIGVTKVVVSLCAKTSAGFGDPYLAEPYLVVQGCEGCDDGDASSGPNPGSSRDPGLGSRPYSTTTCANRCDSGISFSKTP